MSFAVLKSTKMHFTSLGTPFKSSSSYPTLISNEDAYSSPQVTFPDSRFLGAARKCQNCPTNILKIRVPKQGFMRFGSNYKHTHQNTIRELIETFLDEYGCSESTKQGAGGVMESCGAEIRLCDEVGELVVVVGEEINHSSVRISRPELGCRISLDIQTQVHTTSIPFKKIKETQVIVLSLETLPSSSYSNTNANSVPSSPASPFYSPPKRLLEFESGEADIGSGSGLHLENGLEKEDARVMGMGKVYTCFKWNTVRMLGMSFCWGADYVVDLQGNGGEGRKRGRWGVVRKALRGLGAGRRKGRGERAVGLSGLKSKGRNDDGEEGKPLLV